MALTIKSIVELQSFRDWNDATGAYSVFVDQLDPTKGWYFNYFNPGFAKVDLTTGLDIFSSSWWGTDPTSFVDNPDTHEDGTIGWAQDDQNHYYIMNSSRASDSSDHGVLWKIHEGSSTAGTFGNGHFIVDASLEFGFGSLTGFGRALQSLEGYTQKVRPAADGNRYFAAVSEDEPACFAIDTAGSMSEKGYWWITEETDGTNLTFGGSAQAALTLTEGASTYTLTCQRHGLGGNAITVAVDNTTSGAPTVSTDAITLHTHTYTVAAYAAAFPEIFTTFGRVAVTTSGSGTDTFTTAGATNLSGGVEGITHIKVVAGAGLFGEDQLTLTTTSAVGAHTEDYFRIWGCSDPLFNGVFLRPDSNGVGNVFTSSGFFINFAGTRTTSYDADVSAGVLYAGQGYTARANFLDKNGDFWFVFSNNSIGVSGTYDDFGDGAYLVKWHPQDGANTAPPNSPFSANWLNVTPYFVKRSVLGTSRNGIEFGGYFPSNHSAFLGNSLDWAGQMTAVSLTTFLQTAFNDDTNDGANDGSNFFNGTFDSPIAALEVGEQANNTLGLQGDDAPGGVGVNGQLGGIFNTFNPLLVLQDTLNITTAIVGAGVPDPPTQQLRNGRNRSIASYSPWAGIAYKAPASDGYLMVAYEYIGSPAFLITLTEAATEYVEGYLLTSQVDAKSALQNLMAAFFLDVVESDFVLHFIPRGQNPSVLTIPENDLGLEADKAKLIETQVMPQELPRFVDIVYVDPTIDWQQNKQHKARSSRTVKTKQALTMNLPMVLDSTFARQIAEKALYLAWLERKPWAFNLFRPSYMVIDPADVVEFVYQGVTYSMRITGNTIGVNYGMQIQGVSEDPNNYTAVTVAGVDAGITTQNPIPLFPTFLFLRDLPYLQDSDAVADRSQTGYYMGMSAADSRWVGGVLYRSSDDTNFDSVDSSTARVWYGQLNNTLGDPPNLWTWDNVNTIDITVADSKNFVFAGTTDLNVLNGANVLIVGNEVVQYVNATQTSPGRYTLSRLLRGRRNTEQFAYGHGAVLDNPFAEDGAGIIAHISGTPTNSGEYALAIVAPFFSDSTVSGSTPGWTFFHQMGSPTSDQSAAIYTKALTDTTPQSFDVDYNAPHGGPYDWASMMILFKYPPTIVQTKDASAITNPAFTSPTRENNPLLVLVCGDVGGGLPTAITVSDTQGNQYKPLGLVSHLLDQGVYLAGFLATNTKPLVAGTDTVLLNFTPSTTQTIFLAELSFPQAQEIGFDPTTGMRRETSPLSLIDLERFYRGVTVGADITTVPDTDLTILANDLKPAFPVNIGGTRDMSGNLTIGWTRRTRYAGDWLNNTGNVPLNEDSEQYDIEILKAVNNYYLFTQQSVGGAGNGLVTNPNNLLLPIAGQAPVTLSGQGATGDIASETVSGASCFGAFDLYVDYEIVQNDLSDPGQTLPAWEISLSIPVGGLPTVLASASMGAGPVARTIAHYGATQFGSMGVDMNIVCQHTGGTGGVKMIVHAVWMTGAITDSPEIAHSESVVRTISWTPGTYDANGNPETAYSAADQTTDFGSTQPAVLVNVYQISTEVGRGFPGTATV
jgi:hypothetical protein